MPRATHFRAAVSPLALLVLVALAGCGKTVTSPILGPYGSITITAPNDTVTIGSTLPFQATVTDTAGNPVPAPVVSWQSSNPTVATINSQGELTPKLEGTTTVIAEGGGAISNPFVVVVIQDFGWVDQSPTALTLVDLNGVHFTDRLHGWVVGDVGTILTSDNAGLTWRRQTSSSTGYTLNSVFFPTATHGFIVGSAGRILETANGGMLWDVRTGIDTDGGRNLRDVFFFDDKHGFIVGNAGLILRTTDRGATWTRLQPAVTGEDLFSVSATTLPGPDTTAWAVGALGSIVGTVDAGATWQNAISPFVTDATAVTRRTKNEAFAVGVQDQVAITDASGGDPTWIPAPGTPSFTNFYGVSWPVSAQLIAVGENTAGLPTILRSDNQGTTWSVQALPSSAVISGRGLRDVWFVDADRGWVVGKQGTILHTATGGTP